jgi:hypothetical protein
MEVKIKLKSGFIAIPYTDPKTIERIIQGVAELRKTGNPKKENKEEAKQ